MNEPLNPYSPPLSESVLANLVIRRPASSKLVIVMGIILAGGMCWFYYEILKESGLSGVMNTLADYPVFTMMSALLLTAPVLMLRKKPGWPGYLLGSLSSFVFAGYFGWRVVSQFVGLMLGAVPLGFFLVGVAFALPFMILFLRFVFGRPSRQFHGIGLRRVCPNPAKKLQPEGTLP